MEAAAKDGDKFRWRKQANGPRGFKILVNPIGVNDNIASIHIDKDEDHVWIDDLWTDPRYRGKGVAKYILNLAINEIKKLWPDMEVRIVAEPTEPEADEEYDNPPSLDAFDLAAFYKGAGFEEMEGESAANGSAVLWIEKAKDLHVLSELVTPEAITAGMLDFPRKKLPETVWDYSQGEPLPRLKPELRATILAEARKRLTNFGAELIGCNIYGGAATYQYHEGADIDCSLYIDWDDFAGDYEVLEQAFKLVEIPWGGFKLHLFVKPEDQPEQIEVADAVYDVLNDEWKIPPLVLPNGFDPEIFFAPLIEMAEKKASQIDEQMGHVGREWAKLKKALQAQTEEPRDPDVVLNRVEIQKGIVLDEVEKLVRMFQQVWDGRLKLHDQLREQYVGHKNVDQYIRFQFPEVCWKYLDQAGYVDFLKVLTKAFEHDVIEKLLEEL